MGPAITRLSRWLRKTLIKFLLDAPLCSSCAYAEFTSSICWFFVSRPFTNMLFIKIRYWVPNVNSSNTFPRYGYIDVSLASRGVLEHCSHGSSENHPRYLRVAWP